VSNFGRDKSDKNKKHNKINGSEHPIGNEKTTLLSDRSTTDAHPESDLKKGPKKNAAKPRPPGIAPQARRIDPNLKPSNANIVFAQARGLRAKETNHEWQKFVSYYRGLSGKNSTSPDWDAVWQSWVLRAAERLGRDSFVGEESNGHDQHSIEEIPRETWVLIVEAWRRSSNWPVDAGPPPGSRGCKAPSDLVTPS